MVLLKFGFKNLVILGLLSSGQFLLPDAGSQVDESPAVLEAVLPKEDASEQVRQEESSTAAVDGSEVAREAIPESSAKPVLTSSSRFGKARAAVKSRLEDAERRVVANKQRREAAVECSANVAMFAASVALAGIRRSFVGSFPTLLGAKFGSDVSFAQRFMNCELECGVPASVKAIVKFYIARRLAKTASVLGVADVESLSKKERNLARILKIATGAPNVFQRVNKGVNEPFNEPFGMNNKSWAKAFRPVVELKKDELKPQLCVPLPANLTGQEKAIGWVGNIGVYGFFSWLQKLEASDLPGLSKQAVKDIRLFANLIDAGSAQTVMYDNSEFPKELTKLIGKEIVKRELKKALVKTDFGKKLEADTVELYLTLFNELFVSSFIGATMGSAPIAKFSRVFAGEMKYS